MTFLLEDKEITNYVYENRISRTNFHRSAERDVVSIETKIIILLLRIYSRQWSNWYTIVEKVAFNSFYSRHK